MKIIKFGKPGCEPCEKVEKYLKENEVDYTSINPYESEEFELIMKHKVTTVPVTVLVDADGNELSRKAGYNEKALQHLINTYKDK